MKWNKSIRVIRIWSPHHITIRQRLFIKSEIIFGSDPSADIQLKEGEGLCARLDFESNEIYYLKSNKVEALEAGQIFQMGQEVYQWKEIKLFKRQFALAGFLVLLGIAVLMGAQKYYLASGMVVKSGCSSEWEKFASGRWQAERGNEREEKFFEQLNMGKNNFQSALRAKEWAKARAELNFLHDFLEKNAEPSCEVPRDLAAFEAQLSRGLISGFLRDKAAEAAAEEILRFNRKFQSDHLARQETRIIKAAGKIYFEGYRLEEDEPEKSADLIEKAENVCRILGKPPQCFKGGETKGHIK